MNIFQFINILILLILQLLYDNYDCNCQKISDELLLLIHINYKLNHKLHISHSRISALSSQSVISATALIYWRLL